MGELPTTKEAGAIRAAVRAIRARIVSGLLVSLPIVITIWVFYWLFTTLQGLLIAPLASLMRRFLGKEQFLGLPIAWEPVLGPAIAIGLALVFLYFLGHFARTRTYRAIDWLLLRVPVVTTVYKAVSNVVRSLEGQGQARSFQRVVLVPFPHPGAMALAFVTKTLHDSETGRTILCLWVLTGVVPPAGFTLFVPEAEVTDVRWTVNETLQAILSGGITSPNVISYPPSRQARAPEGVLDASGRPIEHPSSPSAH
jgi:uncharacterized membrane protein